MRNSFFLRCADFYFCASFVTAFALFCCLDCLSCCFCKHCFAMFSLEEFVASPTLEVISNVTRDQLVMIAGHYKIDVTGSPVKADLLKFLIDTLSARGLLESVGGEEATGVSKPALLPAPEMPLTPSTPSKAELELRRLQLREKEIEWEREKSKLEADRQMVREREKREH